MDQELDLFGNPYAPARAKGRPPHTSTQESIITVMILVAAGHTNKEVATVLGLDVKTLRKHYGHLLRHRDVMLSRLRSKLRTSQIQQGLAGNATALSGALKVLDTISAERVARDLQDRAANQPAARGYISKKEQRLESAQAVGGKFAVPPAPRLVVSNGQAASEAGQG